jgi:hypothetical protein
MAGHAGGWHPASVSEYPRRGRLRPVLIAVIALLAGVTGTSAYLLVGRYLDAQAQTTGQGTVRTTTPAVTNSTNAADPCPQFTVDAVRAKGRPGNLERVLYVEATLAGTAGAEAWICRDSDGTLYYQGHDRRGPATVATSDYTILLGAPILGGVTQNGATYTATNPSSTGGASTQYIVSAEKLTLVLPSGARTDYTATRTSP